MSDVRDELLAGTSKAGARPAVLLLADGTVFRGTSCGADGTAFGEACFNTSMTGYVECVTDPSYAGQILCLTYPQAGNYGWCAADVQRDRPALAGLVVRDMCRVPSNWRSREALPAYLQRAGVVAIEGVDTRALVRHLRDHGAQQAAVSTEVLDPALLGELLAAAPGLVGENLVRAQSCAAPYRYGAGDLPAGHAFAFADAPAGEKHVVAYDCGMKDGILENLVRAGCRVTVVPWNTSADQVLGMRPDGVLLSNGPGDPDAVEGTFSQVERLLGRVPVFGICLGHQMVGKACGCEIEKLRFGHRGANHPVANLLTGRVEVTSQNHGFGVVFPSLGPVLPEESGGFAAHEADLRTWVRRGVAPVVGNPRFGRIRLTHVNLNDGTPEGMALLDARAFCVQYHPEAQAGPTDSHYLFAAFRRLMDGRSDYLDIDIARDRVAGWRFGEGKEAARA